MGLFVLYLVSRLTLLIFKSSKMALVSSSLFCFNPASIFMSAMYTESVFVLFAFGGYYCFMLREFFAASICFGVATFSRSNGVICVGFFLYEGLRQIVERRVC